MLFENRKFRKPTIERKHMVAISPKGNGFFVVNNWREKLDRETFREIIAESQAEGCVAPYFIYGGYCLFAGPNIEFMQFSADEYR